VQYFGNCANCRQVSHAITTVTCYPVILISCAMPYIIMVKVITVILTSVKRVLLFIC
jgi:hypothetical protein